MSTRKPSKLSKIETATQLKMSGLASSSLNGVKIYNLSSGKTLPQWISQKKKKSLSKDDDYRRRVELVQDFHFPNASQRVRMSPDGNYIVATGVYPPTIKVYDVRELSIKFERRLDSEVLELEVLSENYGKLAFLQADRSVSFHAPYGGHHNMRIPKFGRSMAYHRGNCDLYVGASGSDIYRINLDEGRFMTPFQSNCPAVNVVKLNPIHQLLGVGGEDGVMECWDPRSRGRVGSLSVRQAVLHGNQRHMKNVENMQVSALNFDNDGLTFSLGTTTGDVLLFDLRSNKPVLTKSHQYGLPIMDIKFHDYSKKIISVDSKIIKIWDKKSGDIFTNIEPPADIRDVCVARGGQGDSGVLLVAGEQERVMSYYIPELGFAPKWCSFLDSLTEELEEHEESSVYDDYTFITKKELSALGVEHLIGTQLLKAYMHGFFMDTRLNNKIKSAQEPFAYEKWRKEKIQKKLQEKQSNRITIQKRFPKVNRALAERLMKSKKAPTTSLDTEKDTTVKIDNQFSNPLNDDRFSSMFSSADYEVDEDSAEYKLLHPNASKKKLQKIEDMDSDSNIDDDDDDDDDEEDADRFNLVSDGEDDGSPEGDVSSNDEYEAHDNMIKKKRKRNPKLFELADGEKLDNIVGFGKKEDKKLQKERRKLKKITLGDRIKDEKIKESERSELKKSELGSGIMREMSFIPKNDRKTTQSSDDRSYRKKRGVGSLRLK